MKRQQPFTSATNKLLQMYSCKKYIAKNIAIKFQMSTKQIITNIYIYCTPVYLIKDDFNFIQKNSSIHKLYLLILFVKHLWIWPTRFMFIKL